MTEECFEIKNKIYELKSYLSSDFCRNTNEAKQIYKEIKNLEEKLKIINDQTHD